MKKTLALFLAAFMLLTLASCGNKDAGTLYTEAYEKTNALEYVHSKMEMNYKIEASGVSMEMPMTIESRLHNSAENSVLDMDMTVSMMGMEFTSSIYYADNVAYTEAMGNKTKVTMDPEEFKKLFETNSVSFSKKDFEGVEVTEANGKYSFSTVFDGETYTEMIMENVMSSLLDNLGLDEDSLDELSITISDVALDVIIDGNGYFEKTHMVFDLEIGASGELSTVLGDTNMKLHCDMTVNYLDIGEELTIEAPADLDAYTEASL